MMTYQEYLEWQEYASEYHLPAQRNEIQLGQLGLMASLFLGGKKKPKLDDFMVSIKTGIVKNSGISSASAEDINRIAGV